MRLGLRILTAGAMLTRGKERRLQPCSELDAWRANRSGTTAALVLGREFFQRMIGLAMWRRQNKAMGGKLNEFNRGFRQPSPLAKIGARPPAAGEQNKARNINNPNGARPAANSD